MTKQVAVIEGDDASPEVVRPTVDILTDLDLGIQWCYPVVGEPAIAETGNAFPDAAKDMIDRADTTLFGSSSGSSGAALFYLRWGKQTYANLRPCLYFPGCASPLKKPEGIDFVIVRENLEDLYVRAEGDLSELSNASIMGRTIRRPVHEIGPGRFAIKAITKQGSERVIRFAFETARKRAGKMRVTCTQKHNMLPGTDGYFKEIAEGLAPEYPDVEFETFIIDDFACRLITQPQRFDVVVMPNLYGDIMSDAAAGLVGSLGMAASGCFGTDYAYFEPAHGTAPDIAGQGIINPTATLFTAAMMLDYLDMPEASTRMMSALKKTYAQGDALTPDQGGNGTTAGFCASIRRHLGL